MGFCSNNVKKSNSIEFYQVMQATNQPPSHLYHLQYQLKLYEEYVHIWKSVFFIVKFPNRIVSLLHSEENHNKTSPKNELAKNKQSTQFKGPFYFNINRTNAFANRKKNHKLPI